MWGWGLDELSNRQKRQSSAARLRSAAALRNPRLEAVTDSTQARRDRSVEEEARKGDKVVRPGHGLRQSLVAYCAARPGRPLRDWYSVAFDTGAGRRLLASPGRS